MTGPLTLQTTRRDASATARLSLIANGAHEWRLQSVTGFGQPIPGSGPTASFQLINMTSAVTALTALQDGKVGLGRIPTANRLEVEGDASKTTASGWAANSDRRIKEDIQPVMNALDTLGKVRLVDFRYTDDYRAAHPGIADQRYLNVVAQEFAEVFPDHVKSSGEKLPDGSEILQVDTYPLTIYSAAAVQELHAKHEAAMKEKDAEIGDLKARLERLEKLIEKGAAR
ncbi:MAG: tail fiber domain-containing protein [Verrucomicrobiaceae bacterium]|nr:tail fiber domain-containing protein [Verrucomicrobiaceae bacterium]